MIAGPTASGKTELSVSLAQQTGAGIISVDSRQCYRYLDIGTAKPDSRQLQAVPHYNISVLDPDEDDSVAEFKKRAGQYEETLIFEGKRIIYCGGSTLHLQSLLRPLDDIPSSDADNIKMLNREANEKGLNLLFNRLKEYDPAYAKKMDGLNRQRIIRALDVWMQTGRPLSSFHQNNPITQPDDMAVFILNHPRKELHRRIEKRTDEMIQNGFLDEVKSLLARGYHPGLRSLQTVGYRQAFEHLEGKISQAQMVKDIKTATRRYAKRQLTWFRRWPFATWLDMYEKTPGEAVMEILNHQNLSPG